MTTDSATGKAVLIADSGSTKTDWALGLMTGGVGDKTSTVSTREVVFSGDDAGRKWQFFQTQGINPILMSADNIVAILQKELLPQLLPAFSEGDMPLNIFFYGAGIRPDMVEKMHDTISQAFTDAPPFSTHHPSPVTPHAASDLLGAARALCGHYEGIACILGTGSNSCLYDGTQIVRNTPALGYILGDEGGGAALGKRFLNAVFKGLLPPAVCDDFMQSSGLTVADVIRKVYSEPMPNRFLASMSAYILAHIDNPAVRELVVDNFRQFFRRNISPYDRPDLPVSFVGSIAHYYEQTLREAAREEGFSVGTIVKSPIRRLCQFHS